MRRLIALSPANPRTARFRAECEHNCMRLMAGSGLRGLERTLRSMAREGLPLPLVERRPGLRIWAGLVPPRDAELRITATANRHIRTAHVTWRPLYPAAQTRHRQESRRLQDAFYARYLAAGKRAYATPPGRLRHPDRLILLLGELEADVNNGGFRQFLDNKGRRRALTALRALRTVGATKTATLLQAALGANLTEAIWARLDRQFDPGAEDLPVLAMRSINAGTSRF